MIRNKEVLPNAEIVIDLNGPQGNAFFLLGYADRLAKQLDLDVPPILAAMKAGDYENLLQVFDYYFSDFVILER